MAALNPLTGRQRSYVYFQRSGMALSQPLAPAQLYPLMLVNLLFLLVVLVIVFSVSQSETPAPHRGRSPSISPVCW
jgi:hypothetical protein